METALRTIDGLNVVPYLSDQINPPQVQIDFEIPNYHMVAGDSPKAPYQFAVWAYFGRTNERSAQVLMDTLRDPNDTGSIKYVFEHDATLAAAVDYADVQSVSAPGIFQHPGGTEYLFIKFEIEVVL
jgi:hypothetical protein